MWDLDWINLGFSRTTRTRVVDSSWVAAADRASNNRTTNACTHRTIAFSLAPTAPQSRARSRMATDHCTCHKATRPSSKSLTIAPSRLWILYIRAVYIDVCRENPCRHDWPTIFDEWPRRQNQLESISSCSNRQANSRTSSRGERYHDLASPCWFV